MHYTFNVGSFVCTTLSDFMRERTPRATFPRIDPDEIQKEIDLGGYDLELDRPMPLHGTVLLVDTGEQKILIDAGLPDGQLLTSLAEIGLSPDDIDLIVVTHGDSDHIGGLDHFANSSVVMTRMHYELWTDHTAQMVEDFVKLFRDNLSEEEIAGMSAGRAKYADVLRQLNADGRLILKELHEEIFPGIKMAPAPGHRQEHTAVEIRSDDTMLLHVADAFRHPLQLKRQDFFCLFDSYPKQLATTMLRLFEQASQTKAIVFGAHFEFPALIQIEKEGSTYLWREIE